MLSYLPEEHHEYTINHFIKCRNWHKERNHFFEWLCASEFHWFFVQGLDAIRFGFYVPGVSSLLNGIEASLRITISQIQSSDIATPEPSQYKVLSNNLIKQADELGLPISLLALPGELDFRKNLLTQKPNKIDVEIVRLRNNICHGNIHEYINTERGPKDSFFTPLSLKDLSEKLISVSILWAQELGKVRRLHSLLDHDHLKMPKEWDK